MSFESRSEGEGHDRMTRLTDVALEAIRCHPEYVNGDKAIICIDNADERKGGIGVGGYDDLTEALVRLLDAAKAMGEAEGRQVAIMPMGPPSAN